MFAVCLGVFVLVFALFSVSRLVCCVGCWFCVFGVVGFPFRVVLNCCLMVVCLV